MIRKNEIIYTILIEKLLEFNTVGGAGAVGVQGNAVASNGNVAIPMRTYEDEEEIKKLKKKNKKKKIKK